MVPLEERIWGNVASRALLAVKNPTCCRRLFVLDLTATKLGEKMLEPFQGTLFFNVAFS